MTGDGLPLLPSQTPEYTLSLLGGDGHYRTATAQLWSYVPVISPAVERASIGLWPTPLPRISTSLDRVYYIDGDSTVRWMSADGSSGKLAMTLPGDRRTQVTVAVDPMDQRVAIGTVRYALDSAGYDALPAEVRVETEAAAGGSPTTLLDYTVKQPNDPRAPAVPPVEWPVAWVQGHLVLGTVYPALQQGATNAAKPEDLLVVDASSGATLTDVCHDADLVDPFRLAQGGTVCEAPDGSRYPELVTWGGQRSPIPALGSCPSALATSPAGGRFVMEGAPGDARSPCSFGGPMTIVGPGSATTTLSVAGLPVGWLDPSTVLYSAFDHPSPTAGPSTTLSIINIETGVHHDSGLSGAIEGYLPVTTVPGATP